jgi:hypothetical protein
MEVSANRVSSFEEAKQPGDFWWAEEAKRMHFRCPCGCGQYAGVEVKPANPNGWDWNGDADKPTVRPSISINSHHWHGFVKQVATPGAMRHEHNPPASEFRDGSNLTF